MKINKYEIIIYFALVAGIVLLLFFPVIIKSIDRNYGYEGKTLTLSQIYVDTYRENWNKRIESGLDLSSMNLNKADNYFSHLLETIPADQKRHVLSEQKENILLYLIDINKQRNNTNKTLRLYKRLLDFESLNIHYRVEYANYLYELDRINQSLEQLDKILQLDRTNIYATQKKIALLNELGKNDLALKTYKDYQESNFTYYEDMQIFYTNNQNTYSGERRVKKKVVIDNMFHNYSFPIRAYHDIKQISKILINPLSNDIFFEKWNGTLIQIKSISFMDSSGSIFLRIDEFENNRGTNIKLIENNTFQILGMKPYYSVNLPENIQLTEPVIIVISIMYEHRFITPYD